MNKKNKNHANNKIITFVEIKNNNLNSSIIALIYKIIILHKLIY